MKKIAVLIMLFWAVLCQAATITSATSGEWNVGSTWVGGSVPDRFQSVVIASGHTVTHNYDGSGTTYATITVNGTLELASSASSSLSLSGSLTGSGTLQCGSASSPLPASRTAVVSFTGANGVSGSSGLTVLLYCDEISTPATALTGAEGTGDAVITVDDDITATYNDLSADGRTVYIRIDDTTGVPESTLEAISSIDGTGTVITLTNNLDAAKSAGAKVLFITRNIRFVANHADTDIFSNVSNGVFGCEISGTVAYDKGIYYCTGLVSGTVSGCAYAFYQSSGTVSGVITGFTSNSTSRFMLTGTISGGSTAVGLGAVSVSSTGVIFGCNYGAQNSIFSLKGTIAYCTYALYRSSGVIDGGTVSYCTTGLYQSSATGYGATLSNNTTVNSGYSTLPSPMGTMIENYGGTAGDFWGWTIGGVITKDTATYPNGALGFPYVYLFTKDSTSNICYKQSATVVDAYENLVVNGIIKIGGDNSTYIPRLEIIDASDDTLVGGTALAVDYLDTYDSSQDWQRVSVNWRNTTAAPKTVIIRMSCGTPSQNIYGSWDYATANQWLGRRW